MRALRANPHFAPLFAHVHALCWPILWWSLNRLLRWYASSGYEEILYGTTPWGYVYIAYLGDRKSDPSAYRPYELTKPRWDDPVWSTNVPTPLLALTTAETLRPCPHPPLRSGGGVGLRSLWRSRLTEGACTLSSIPNTS
ncbi:hypothetical protein [Hyphomonas sp.]|uniref:hypothetical protein n=1 Tax=Hyphomonas sp. TaxID=87 RepID=UPI00391DC872